MKQNNTVKSSDLSYFVETFKLGQTLQKSVRKISSLIFGQKPIKMRRKKIILEMSEKKDRMGPKITN